jgi:hypothetical protein
VLISFKNAAFDVVALSHVPPDWYIDGGLSARAAEFEQASQIESAL